MFDRSDVVSTVLGSSNGARVKHLFSVDTTTYSWVKDFVRDRQIRKSIQALTLEISKTRALPIAKTEVRAYFKSYIDEMNSYRLKELSEVLREYQERKGPMANNELFIGHTRIFGDRVFMPFRIEVSDSELDEIFREFPAGTSKETIEIKVSKLLAEIATLETVLAEELSPQERWFYTEGGAPMPFPKGCRWTQFVEVWEAVAIRFSGPVNIEGRTPESGDESAAYLMLGLGEKIKRSPLREPL